MLSMSGVRSAWQSLKNDFPFERNENTAVAIEAVLTYHFIAWRKQFRAVDVAIEPSLGAQDDIRIRRIYQVSLPVYFLHSGSLQ